MALGEEQLIANAVAILRQHDPELYQACQRVLERRKPRPPLTLVPDPRDQEEAEEAENAHCIGTSERAGDPQQPTVLPFLRVVSSTATAEGGVCP